MDELSRAKALITPELGLSEDAAFDCRLAITEAVANALAHGQRDGRSYCRVQVRRGRGAIVIAVEDHGPGFRWQGLRARMPPPHAERGRGVPLIRLLMDGVAISSSSRGTRIEMVKRLPPTRS